jgi:hypothetical protein
MGTVLLFLWVGILHTKEDVFLLSEGHLAWMIYSAPKNGEKKRGISFMSFQVYCYFQKIGDLIKKSAI